jgi:hypothetical protein
MSTVLASEGALSASNPAALPSKTLDYFPIGMFGSVMSLTILSVWHLAEQLDGDLGDCCIEDRRRQSEFCQRGIGRAARHSCQWIDRVPRDPDFGWCL